MSKLFRQILIPFFALCSLYAQAAQLTIHIMDCRNKKQYTYLTQLEILKDGKEFKTLTPNSIEVLRNLKPGKYTLSYTSIFDKKESVTVEIHEQKKYAVDICIDFMDYTKETYQPVIDRLAEKDSFTIAVYSQGCFFSDQDSLIIKRDKEIYTVTYKEKIKILTSGDIETIRHFEMELNYMMGGGCTTTDTYIIRYTDFMVLIADGGCQWHGANYLKRQLFGKKTE